MQQFVTLQVAKFVDIEKFFISAAVSKRSLKLFSGLDAVISLMYNYTPFFRFNNLIIDVKIL